MKGLILFVLAAASVGMIDAPTAEAGWLFRNRTPIVVRVVRAQPVRAVIRSQPVRSVIRQAPIRMALGIQVRSCPNGQCPTR